MKKIILLLFLVLTNVSIYAFNFGINTGALNFDGETMKTGEVLFLMPSRKYLGCYKSISFLKGFGGNIDNEENYDSDIWLFKFNLHHNLLDISNFKVGYVLGIGYGEYGTVINANENWQNQKEKEDHFAYAEIKILISYKILANSEIGVYLGVQKTTEFDNGVSEIRNLNGINGGITFNYLVN